MLRLALVRLIRNQFHFRSSVGAVIARAEPGTSVVLLPERLVRIVICQVLNISERHHGCLLWLWNFLYRRHHAILLPIGNVQPQELHLNVFALIRLSIGTNKLAQFLVPALLRHKVLVQTKRLFKKNIFGWSAWSSIWKFTRNIKYFKKNLLFQNRL